MRRVSNWFDHHGFQHEDPNKVEVTPKTMWESVLLVILIANIIFFAIMLLFPYLAH